MSTSAPSPACVGGRERPRDPLRRHDEKARTDLWQRFAHREFQTPRKRTVGCAAPVPGEPWRLLTRGFEKSGRELSLAIPRQGAELPAWALAFFDEVVRRARALGKRLDAGQVVALDAPHGGLVAAVLDDDAALSASGVPVLRAVGITADEERAARAWCPRGLLEVLATVDPHLTSDPARRSLLTLPRARAAIEARAEREGSCLGVVEARTSVARKTGGLVTWRVDAHAAEAIDVLLRGRTQHLRPFSVTSDSLRVDVVPAAAIRAELSRSGLVVELTQPAARELRARLHGVHGRQRWEALPGLVLDVVA